MKKVEHVSVAAVERERERERERELYFRELKDSIISYIYKKIAIKA